MSWFRRKPEPPQQRWRLHWFAPQPDITTHELATILANLHAGSEYSTIADGVYFEDDRSLEEFFRAGHGMPELARHFTRTETVESFTV